MIITIWLRWGLDKWLWAGLSSRLLARWRCAARRGWLWRGLARGLTRWLASWVDGCLDNWKLGWEDGERMARWLWAGLSSRWLARWPWAAQQGWLWRGLARGMKNGCDLSWVDSSCLDNYKLGWEDGCGEGLLEAQDYCSGCHRCPKSYLILRPTFIVILQLSQRFTTMRNLKDYWRGEWIMAIELNISSTHLIV